MTDDSIQEIQMEKPLNEFECARFDITDQMLNKSKLAVYLGGQTKTDSKGKEKPYNEKTAPERAVYIRIPAGTDEKYIEIWFDRDAMAWDSNFIYEGRPCKLSFEQLSQFFKSDFYRKLMQKLSKTWPLSDPTFGEMFDGLMTRRMKVGFEEGINPNLAENDMPGKRVDLANKDITGDGQRDYSSTGRKIIQDFGDNGVDNTSGEYYCWPNPNFPYKWSQWKDWTKIKPLCKMYFKFNNRRYMISLAPFDEEGDQRGFRGADCDWDPPLAWLTPGECADIVKLSIVRRFIKQCMKRIKEYVNQPAEDIFDKMNNKEKITLDEIRKTQSVIKHTMNVALRNEQADTYCFED